MVALRSSAVEALLVEVAVVVSLAGEFVDELAVRIEVPSGLDEISSIVSAIVGNPVENIDVN